MGENTGYRIQDTGGSWRLLGDGEFRVEFLYLGLAELTKSSSFLRRACRITRARDERESETTPVLSFRQ